MFHQGEIWAYPTDTSFGLGVRADDARTLKRLAELKGRGREKYFSLMVRDFAMLQEFAEVPDEMTEAFFMESPKTAILKPTSKLPASEYWPAESVAFRVCTIPEIARKIEYPITATSANLSGGKPIFDTWKLRRIFRDRIKIVPNIAEIPEKDPSEIWNFTVKPPVRLR
ncbi:Sua5/YciO/YrdC/YwlC family protein [Candidatus Gracilibacteria bacterium]|nr:Sua5/YciO/YrdC/YwlC family protein [Candidatus Gracilibacteria bacterium]